MLSEADGYRKVSFMLTPLVSSQECSPEGKYLKPTSARSHLQNLVGLNVKSPCEEVSPQPQSCWSACGSPYSQSFAAFSGYNSPMCIHERTPSVYFEESSEPYNFFPSAETDEEGENEPAVDTVEEVPTLAERLCLEPIEPTAEVSCGTTLMLRNLPNKYTRDMLLEEISRRGLLQHMDFFYLPIDTRHACNVGYCFINVTSSAAADLFREAFNGVRLKQVRSKKTCFVGLGQIQGLQANIDAYRNSAITNQMNEAFRPMLFENGVAKPFPTPTRNPGKSKYLNGMAQVKKSVSSRPVSTFRSFPI